MYIQISNIYHQWTFIALHTTSRHKDQEKKSVGLQQSTCTEKMKLKF